jgi:hypothetical protein
MLLPEAPETATARTKTIIVAEKVNNATLLIWPLVSVEPPGKCLPACENVSRQDASHDPAPNEPTEAQAALLVALSASAKSPLSGLPGKHSGTCGGKAFPDVVAADRALV